MGERRYSSIFISLGSRWVELSASRPYRFTVQEISSDIRYTGYESVWFGRYVIFLCSISPADYSSALKMKEQVASETLLNGKDVSVLN
jgi:hypothetical protein